MKRVTNEELYNFCMEFGKKVVFTTESRFQAALKAKFYGREDARQLRYRCEHLGLIKHEDERIKVRKLSV